MTTTTRIRAGLYEVTTGAGTFTVERREFMSPASIVWFVTFPGCTKPDDWAHTLRGAKLMVAAFEAPVCPRVEARVACEPCGYPMSEAMHDDGPEVHA